MPKIGDSNVSASCTNIDNITWPSSVAPVSHSILLFPYKARNMFYYSMQVLNEMPDLWNGSALIVYVYIIYLHKFLMTSHYSVSKGHKASNYGVRSHSTCNTSF